MLYTYALGFTRNREEAEDVVQDVYIYFWNHRYKIEYTESIYGYLSRAVKNNCINLKHREVIKVKYEQETLNTGEDTTDWNDVEHLREMRTRLLDIMAQLPEKCREIFIKSCIDGMKYKDIAQELGISKNTVKIQVKLAYKKIRKEVEDTYLLILFVLISFIR